MFFADEPILRVTAPLPEAQLVETRLINILHFQIADCFQSGAHGACRARQAARRFRPAPRTRRRSRPMAARASYIAGFAGTATVLADKLFGIPIFGTMAHSFIQAHDDETAAFERFARAGLTTGLLIDTYDTEAAARKVVALAPGSRRRHHVSGVRLDSGDLIALSKSVRASSMRAGCGRDASSRAAGSMRTASSQ